MKRPQIARALSYLPLYMLCFGLASALWRSPGILAACYVVMSCFMLLRWHTRSDLAYFFLALALGPLGELVAVHYGAWKYAAPAPTLLIPIWLPLAWGISGLFLKKTTEALASSATVTGHRCE